MKDDENKRFDLSKLFSNHLWVNTDAFEFLSLQMSSLFIVTATWKTEPVSEKKFGQHIGMDSTCKSWIGTDVLRLSVAPIIVQWRVVRRLAALPARWVWKLPNEINLSNPIGT